MRKWTIFFFLITLAAIGVFWLMRAPLFSLYLTQKLEMSVSVERIRIDFSGIKIGNFHIRNSWKYKTPYALQVKEVQISYQWNRVRGDPSVIDRIEMNEVSIGIEFDERLSAETNWSDLLDRLSREKPHGKEVMIQKLVLTDVTVEIVGKRGTAGKQIKTIPRMEFSNISSKKGFPVHELIVQIFGQANLMEYIKDLIFPNNDAGGIFKKLLPFKSSQNKPEP
jgi:hypothetical protein